MSPVIEFCSGYDHIQNKHILISQYIIPWMCPAADHNQANDHTKTWSSEPVTEYPMVFIFNGQPLMDEMAACESHDEDHEGLGNSQADLFTCRADLFTAKRPKQKMTPR